MIGKKASCCGYGFLIGDWFLGEVEVREQRLSSRENDITNNLPNGETICFFFHPSNITTSACSKAIEQATGKPEAYIDMFLCYTCFALSVGV